MMSWVRRFDPDSTKPSAVGIRTLLNSQTRQLVNSSTALLIEVCFKGNRKEFFLWEGEDPPALKSGVIVEADRGEDLGHVHAVGEAAQFRAKGVSHGPGETPVSQVARRLASSEDLKRLKELREQDE